MPEVANQRSEVVNKTLRHAAAVIVLAFAATACSGGSGPSELPEYVELEGSYEYVEVSAPDSSVAVDGDPGDVVEQDCPELLVGTGLRCVWVIVPIDRADPAAGNMGVSVAIRPGTGGESLAPLAVLQGGPGGASSTLAQVLPSRPCPQVLIDQRGVGFGSSSFWCVELLHSLVAIVEATRERAEAIESGAVAQCVDRLGRDPVFGHTTTAAHAADVIDVMAALGYEQWRLYGVSYGTTIALEVLRDAPAGLTGAVLDGVLPGYLDQDAGVAAGADRVIQKLDEECSADPACSAILAGAVDDEGATMAGLLAELIPRFNADPIVVSLSGEETTMQEPIDALIDGDSVAGAVFALLYNEFTAPLVPGVLAGLARPSGTDTAEEAGVITAPRLVALIGVESASEQFHSGAPATRAAVACAEWVPQASGPPAGVSEFAAAVVGEGLSEQCQLWGIAESSSPAEPVESDAPVLLISGLFDPITPPDLAEEAAEHLTAATHIVSRTRGHGIWVWGYDSCVARIVADFLAEPGTDLDTACALEDRPLRWQPLP